MPGLLVLSPHLDDAALSCGGAIARWVREGGQATVVTLFAGDDPESPRSKLEQDLARWWGLPLGSVVAHRREEDLAASAELGATPLHGPLREAPYRRDAAAGKPLFPTLASLFAASAPEETELARELEAFLATLPAAEAVWAPLGVGGHVDHRRVRAAAETAYGPRLAYYEEYPYAARRWGAVWRVTRPRRAWRSETVPLAESDVAARWRAIACFRSQLAALFGGADRGERALRRRIARQGGERLWRRRQGVA
ncbi:MAG TPA: PIG-L family deacetylase [Thermoanaerobaculia bacterium]|nr:PIG-L family deacetylase [Thermoanaerobaculia bacterium]